MSEKCLTCEVYSRYCCKCVVHGDGKEVKEEPQPKPTGNISGGGG